MKDRHALLATLHHLYSLEINCGLSCFWDGGWDLWIGDELNGISAEGSVERLDDAAAWLRKHAADVVRGWRRARRAMRARAAFQVAREHSSPPSSEREGSREEPKPTPQPPARGDP